MTRTILALTALAIFAIGQCVPLKGHAHRSKRQSNMAFFPSFGVCEYILFPHKKSRGGEVSSAQTIDACEEECSSNSLCRAYEFNDSPGRPWRGIRCRLHKTHELQMEPSPGIDNYVREPCFEPGCEDTFAVSRNSYIRHGTPYQEIPNIYECAQACRDNSFCFAFDFSVEDITGMDSRCWLHEDVAMYINPIDHEKVDFYWKASCSNDDDRIIWPQGE